MRASLFPTSMLDVKDPDLWQRLAGDVPLANDRLQLMPIQQRVQSGTALNGTLQVQAYPHRIDIVLAADGTNGGPGAPPVIADMAQGLQEAADLAIRAAGAPGHRFTRLAFAIQVLEPHPSPQDSLDALRRALPGLPIRPGDNEAMFQRGRETLPGGDLPPVNFIEKWSTATLQMVPMPMLAPGTMEAVATDVHVLMLDVEANTRATPIISMAPDEAASAMSHLIRQARGAFA